MKEFLNSPEYRATFEAKLGSVAAIGLDTPALTEHDRRHELQRLAWFIEGGATNTRKFEQALTVATGGQPRSETAARKKRNDAEIRPFRS